MLCAATWCLKSSLHYSAQPPGPPAQRAQKKARQGHGAPGCDGWGLRVTMEVKAVWKVGEAWVEHRERTGRTRGVGGAVLCGSRAALCQGKGMPGKLGDRRTSFGQFLDEHLELRDTSPCKRLSPHRSRRTVGSFKLPSMRSPEPISTNANAKALEKASPASNSGIRIPCTTLHSLPNEKRQGRVKPVG